MKTRNILISFFCVSVVALQIFAAEQYDGRTRQDKRHGDDLDNREAKRRHLNNAEKDAVDALYLLYSPPLVPRNTNTFHRSATHVQTALTKSFVATRQEPNHSGSENHCTSRRSEHHRNSSSPWTCTSDELCGHIAEFKVAEEAKDIRMQMRHVYALIYRLNMQMSSILHGEPFDSGELKNALNYLAALKIAVNKGYLPYKFLRDDEVTNFLEKNASFKSIYYTQQLLYKTLRAQNMSVEQTEEIFDSIEIKISKLLKIFQTLVEVLDQQPKRTTISLKKVHYNFITGDMQFTHDDNSITLQIVRSIYLEIFRYCKICTVEEFDVKPLKKAKAKIKQ